MQMENALLSLMLQIRQQIRKEKDEYLKAIENGRPSEAREIAERITRLQSEIQKLQPQERNGYQGF